MKIKRVLRFYFSADKINGIIDRVITAKACNPYPDGRDNAEAIAALISEKKELAVLWQYLDGLVRSFADGEAAALEEYAYLRCGLNSLDCGRRREIRRSAIKFMRRCRRLEGFAEGLRLVGKYYCLM